MKNEIVKKTKKKLAKIEKIAKKRMRMKFDRKNPRRTKLYIKKSRK